VDQISKDGILNVMIKIKEREILKSLFFSIIKQVIKSVVNKTKSNPQMPGMSKNIQNSPKKFINKYIPGK
jgi:hypothetical protein